MYFADEASSDQRQKMSCMYLSMFKITKMLYFFQAGVTHEKKNE